ncbi:ABC transporter permease [Cohnella endophytica]|uniref:ABC transporter permease n=1 Tax=Cohnella endophytica TaxID=2419778 RepID=A0A494Y1I7_9BACL|nr:ABC transporter permease [Cohnella endophytica]RKP54297.1 ABC transporter permease [Cohnella endophytica]
MDIATLGHMLNTAFVFSTALILAALGGIISERSGVVNIGLEGLMTAGAFAAAVSAYRAQEAGYGSASPWIGLLAGALFGVLFALIHAVATITFRADQVVSGIVINFIAGGTTLYLVKLLFDGAGETPLVDQTFHKWKIPGLSDIPIIGDGIFNSYPTTYLALILVGVIFYMLYKTSFGLRLRAVGEHPSAADTVGIKVLRMRYTAVLMSGVLAGIGGATIALTTTGTFSHNTISGQGFIALAAVIFGKWNPLGALGAAVFFGFAQSINNVLQLFDFSSHIPAEFIYMLPYVLTILVLVGAVGRSKAPGALGEPYFPGKR